MSNTFLSHHRKSMRTLANRLNILSLVLIKHDLNGKRMNVWGYEHMHLFPMNKLIWNILHILKMNTYFYEKLKKIMTWIIETPNATCIYGYGQLDNYGSYLYGKHNTYHFLNGMVHRDSGPAVTNSKKNSH